MYKCELRKDVCETTVHKYKENAGLSTVRDTTGFTGGLGPCESVESETSAA